MQRPSSLSGQRAFLHPNFGDSDPSYRGYGLRYHYGMFWQQISTDGSQIEAPDPWLNHANPWEVHRPDVTYPVRFYGYAERLTDGKAVSIDDLLACLPSHACLQFWSGGQEVVAVAFDVPIPGSYTRNTNNLRLWGMWSNNSLWNILKPELHRR